MYLILFLVGALGFVGMSLLGFLHGGGAHHGAHGGGGHFHLPHFGGHAHGISHGHGAPAGPHAAAAGPHAGGHLHVPDSPPPAFQNYVMASASFLSPLNIFSVCLGFGATGLLLKNAGMTSTVVLMMAIVGALLFHFGVMRQVMNLVFRFESKPMEGLAGAVAKTAEAATPFDSSGRGVVKLTLDGRIVQLLATLDASEMSHGVTVARGDQVVVIDVDPVRNTCRVTREFGLSESETQALPRSETT